MRSRVAVPTHWPRGGALTASWDVFEDGGRVVLDLPELRGEPLVELSLDRARELRDALTNMIDAAEAVLATLSDGDTIPDDDDEWII